MNCGTNWTLWKPSIKKNYSKTHEFKAIGEKDMPRIYVTRALQNVGKKGLPVTIFVHGGGGNMNSGLAD